MKKMLVELKIPSSSHFQTWQPWTAKEWCSQIHPRHIPCQSSGYNGLSTCMESCQNLLRNHRQSNDSLPAYIRMYTVYYKDCSTSSHSWTQVYCMRVRTVNVWFTHWASANVGHFLSVFKHLVAASLAYHQSSFVLFLAHLLISH